MPQLFGAAGADQLDDPQNFPWTIGFNPATSTEGRIYAKHILATKPDAKIGVLYQNDQLGKTFLAGVRDGLGAEHAGALVKEVSYEVTDPTVNSQVITLQGAGVDALIIAATSKPAAQTIRKVYDMGWTPERYLFFGAASIAGTLKPAGLEKSKGLITAGYLKDPTVPIWQDDPGFKEWAAFATKYMSPTDVREGMAVYGFTTAATMVHVLEAMRRRSVAGEYSAPGARHQGSRAADAAAGRQDQHFARQLFPDPANAARPVQRRNVGALWRIDQRLSRRKFAHLKGGTSSKARRMPWPMIAMIASRKRRWGNVRSRMTALRR